MNSRVLTITAIFIALLFINNQGALAGPADWLSSTPKKTDKDEFSEAGNDYRLNCTPCHGENGDGNGQLASSLSKPPRNHLDAKYMSGRTDEQLFKAISEGGAAVGKAEDMPPHNTTLSKGAIQGLVKYLRHLCDCQYKKK